MIATDDPPHPLEGWGSCPYIVDSGTPLASNTIHCRTSSTGVGSWHHASWGGVWAGSKDWTTAKATSVLSWRSSTSRHAFVLTEFPITGTAGKKKAETNTQVWARRLLVFCGPTQDLHVTYIHIHISIYLHNPTQEALLHRIPSYTGVTLSKKLRGSNLSTLVLISEHLPLPHWILRVPYTEDQRHPENAPALELASNSWQETRRGLWKCSMLLHKSYRLVVAVLKRVPWKGKIMNIMQP